MTVSIHFCLAQLEERINLVPATSWEFSDVEQSMFVVRSTDVIEDGVIQVQVDGEILWSSPIRPVPADGLDHPFTNQEDTTLVYVASKIIRRSDLVLHSNYYEVALVMEGRNVYSIPLMVDWEDVKEPVVAMAGSILSQENVVSTDASGNLIANATVAVEQEEEEYPFLDDMIFEGSEEEELGRVSEGGELELTIDSEQAEAEVDTDEAHDAVIPEYASVNREVVSEKEDLAFLEKYGVKLSTLLSSHSASVNEEEVDEATSPPSEVVEEPVTETTGLLYNQEQVGRLLAKVAKQKTFTVESKPKEEVPAIGAHQIIVEKMGTSYIAVLNDTMTRPMYLMINSEFIHEWTNSLEKYLEWLQDQVVKMFNIPAEEYQQWLKLVITEESAEPQLEQEIENVTIISRNRALTELQNVYPALIDVASNGTYGQFTFEDAPMQLLLQTQHDEQLELREKASYLALDSDYVSDIGDYLNSTIEEWLFSFGNIPVMVTGFGSLNQVRSSLSENIDYASSFPNTNLAWEVAHRIRTQQKS